MALRPEIDPNSQQLVEHALRLTNEGKQPAEILDALLGIYSEEPPRRCRQCGCTDDQACLPPCWWVEDDLCSTCHAGQSLDLSGAVVAHEGDQVLLLCNSRLTMAQAAQATERLQAQVPGVAFTIVDQVSTAIVVDRGLTAVKA